MDWAGLCYLASAAIPDNNLAPGLPTSPPGSALPDRFDSPASSAWFFLLWSMFAVTRFLEPCRRLRVFEFSSFACPCCSHPFRRCFPSLAPFPQAPARAVFGPVLIATLAPVPVFVSELLATVFPLFPYALFMRISRVLTSCFRRY